MNTSTCSETTSPKGPTAGTAGLVLLAAIGLAPLAGCLHANLPGETQNSLADTDPNIFPTPKLMALSLEYVANRYPPTAGTAGSEPTFAFNLPAGMRRDNCELVASMLQGHGVPVTRENASRLPIYHISTMWIRGTRAEVEMVYPFEAVGMSPGSQPVYRGVTLKLGTDMGPWRVMRQQLWNVGTIPVPQLHFLPEGDAAEGTSSTEDAAPADAR